MPAGYLQIPSTGLYVRENDGSGPYYLDANGDPQPMSAGGGEGVTWDAGATWDAGTFWI